MTAADIRVDDVVTPFRTSELGRKYEVAAPRNGGILYEQSCAKTSFVSCRGTRNPAFGHGIIRSADLLVRRDYSSRNFTRLMGNCTNWLD